MAGGVGNDGGIELSLAAMAAVLHEGGEEERTEPAVVGASSSSVYRLNTEAPSSEEHRMDRTHAFACRPWMEPWGVGRRRKGILDFFTSRAYMSRLLNGENMTEDGLNDVEDKKKKF